MIGATAAIDGVYVEVGLALADHVLDNYLLGMLIIGTLADGEMAELTEPVADNYFEGGIYVKAAETAHEGYEWYERTFPEDSNSPSITMQQDPTGKYYKPAKKG
jgi:hypothetical protein